MSNTKNMLTQSLDGLMPFITSMIPKETANKHVCTLLYENFKNLNSDKAKKIIEQLVYEKSSENCNAFSSFIDLCEYLDALTISRDTKANAKTIKQLNTILMLPSSSIVEKNIDFRIANIDITETIKKATSNGYTYESCDKMLHFIHMFIFKFLSMKLSEISVSNICKSIDDIANI